MKISTKLLLVPAVVILIAGCSKEPTGHQPKEQKEYKTKTVRIGIKVDEKTKMTYDWDKQGLIFEEGDKIGVIYHEPKAAEIPEFGRNMPFTFLEYNETEDTYYFGGAIVDDDETVYNFCAYYPYTELAYSEDQQNGYSYHTWPYSKATVIRSIFIPHEQEYVEGTWKGGIAAATFTGTADNLALTFKPFFNVIKFTVEIPADAEVSYDELTFQGIFVSGNYQHDMFGADCSFRFPWNESDDGISVLLSTHASSSFTSKSMLLLMPEEGVTVNKGESHDFYMMISNNSTFPKGLTVRFVLKGYNPVVASTESQMDGFGGTQNIFTLPKFKFDQELTPVM